MAGPEAVSSSDSLGVQKAPPNSIEAEEALLGRPYLPMPCRSLASFLSHDRYCSDILRSLLDRTSHMPNGFNISCCVFNLPRRYASGFGYLLKSFGNIILTCFLYVRLRHITATMCFHFLCGARICCCTIRSSTIVLIILQLYV